MGRVVVQELSFKLLTWELLSVQWLRAQHKWSPVVFTLFPSWILQPTLSSALPLLSCFQSWRWLTKVALTCSYSEVTWWNIIGSWTRILFSHGDSRAIYTQKCLFLLLRCFIKTFVNLHRQIEFPKEGGCFFLQQVVREKVWKVLSNSWWYSRRPKNSLTITGHHSLLLKIWHVNCHLVSLTGSFCNRNYKSRLKEI